MSFSSSMDIYEIKELLKAIIKTQKTTMNHIANIDDSLRDISEIAINVEEYLQDIIDREGKQ